MVSAFQTWKHNLKDSNKGEFAVPIYEYQCEKCGKKIEKIVLSEKDIPKLCECGGELVKVISASTFILKGSGFYATDYKNKE